MIAGRVCLVPGCGKPREKAKFCQMHRHRLRKHGNVKGRLVSCDMCGDYFWANSKAVRCRGACAREDNKIRSKAWNEDNPDKYSSRRDKWYRDNRDVILVKNKVKYEQNKLKVLEDTARWAQENPEAIKFIKKNYKLRRAGWLGNAFKVSNRSLARILNNHGMRCAYCKATLGANFHWDHVVPLSRGGTHGEGNLVPACPACNISKNNKTVTEWRVWMRLVGRKHPLTPVLPA